MYAGFLEEGDRCRETECEGHLAFQRDGDCSCHISPPCAACTDAKLTCSECGWQDEPEPYHDVPVVPGLAMREYAPRPLDPTKVDYRCKMKSSSSMIKEGVYPEGMSADEVRKVVDGTFGGRFERFENGKFKFIAYTD